MNPKQSSNASTLERALKALEKMEAKLASVERAKTEPIAIVGMACRFPGSANTPQALWERATNLQDSITQLPQDRNRVPGGDSNPFDRRAGWLRDIDQFDADFFGISRNEAIDMDPQQRLLLEVAWEALEDAALRPERLQSSKTGVFIGSSARDYLDVMAASGDIARPYVLVGNAASMAAGRLAHLFGLHGPCANVDSACASSLVALHLACQSLRARECDMAIVGGANLLLNVKTWEQLDALQILSNHGQCRTFDARADGYARAEGIGVVIVERLSDAQTRRDPIWALVRGSAVNHNGHGTSLTAPNVQAQGAVVQAALEDAKIAADRVGYVEVHSNGSPLGDAIELEALKSTVGKTRANGSKCILGSIKTLIGHAEAASGMASLMKTVFVLRNGIVPQNLHFNTLTPYADIGHSALTIASSPMTWERGDQSRIAGVSATGISGTNAHVLLEEPPPATKDEPNPVRSLHALILSAKSKEALIDQAKRLVEHLVRHEAEDFGAFCHTLAVGRQSFEHRFGVVVTSRDEALSELANFARGVSGRYFVGRTPNGSMRKRMGLFLPDTPRQAILEGLAELNMPAFHEALRRVDEVASVSLGHVISPNLARVLGSQVADDLIEKEAAMFAIQYATIEMWRALGIDPLVMLGHGTGECVAAWAAGFVELSDAFALAVARARALASQGRDIQGVLDTLRRIARLPPRRTLISGKQGNFSANSIVSPEYWIHSIQSTEASPDTVRESLLDHELGAVLSCAGPSRADELSYPTSADDMFVDIVRFDKPLTWTMLEAATKLYVRGYEPNWQVMNAPYGYQRIRLPTYPFQRQKYWFVESKKEKTSVPESLDHPLLGRLLDGRPDQPEARVWAHSVDVSASRAIRFERFVEVQSISSASALAVADGALRESFGESNIRCSIGLKEQHAPVTGESCTVQVIVARQDAARADVNLYWRSRQDLPWVRLAQGQGTLITIDDAPPAIQSPQFEPIVPKHLWEHRLSALGFPLDAFALDRIVRYRDVTVAHGTIIAKCGPEIFLQIVGALASIAYPGMAGRPWNIVELNGFAARREWLPGRSSLRLKWSARDPSTARATAEFLEEAGNLLARAESLEFGIRDPIALHHAMGKDPFEHAIARFEWEERASTPANGRENRRWLVIGDSGEMGTMLARRLENLGESAVTMNAAQLTTNLEHLDELLTTAGPFSGVVHCGMLDVPSAGQGPDAALQEAYREWMQLVYPMIERLLRREIVPRLWVVTRGAQTPRNEMPTFAHAGVVGLGRIANREYPEVWGGVIDLDADAPAGEVLKLADALIGNQFGEVIALRQSKQYVLRLQEHAPQKNEPLPVRSDRTYVVSRGLSPLGYEIAQWLVKRGAKSLLFVDEPRVIAAQGETRKRLGALEGNGVKVSVFGGDLTDMDTLQGILYLAFDQIAGVIHLDQPSELRSVRMTSAGALDELLEQWRRSCLVPWTLHGLTVDLAMDFFVVVSSLGSAIARETRGAEVINADFFNAIVGHHRHRGGRALSLYATAAFEERSPETEMAREWIADGIQAIPAPFIMPVVERLLMQNVSTAIAGWINWNDVANGQLPRAMNSVFQNMIRVPSHGASTIDLRQRVMFAAPMQRRALVENALCDELRRSMESGAPAELDSGASLSASGIDSILAVQTLTTLGKSFGTTIPTRVLLGNPAITDVAQRIVESLQEAEIGPGGGRRASNSSEELLVDLNPSSLARPFFCVHPVTGSALVFQSLAKELTSAVRFYGFNAPGVETDATPCDKVEILAHRYVESLRRMQPEGPYRIGGYSFGAPIAFEMARILRQDGKQIEACVLFDPMSPLQSDDASRLMAMMRLLGTQVDDEVFRQGVRAEMIAAMASSVGAGLLLPSDLGTSAKQLRVYRAHLHALLEYVPESYDGPVILLRAEETAALAEKHQLYANDKTFGWAKTLSQGITVCDVPGNHFSLLTEPHVARTARVVREALESVQKR